MRLLLVLLLLAWPAQAQDLWDEMECARLGGCTLVPKKMLQDVLQQHRELQIRFEALKGRRGCA